MSRFLFTVVIHSGFSTPLNILYPSKMQGKLLSLYLPSYQHKVNSHITLSYFLPFCTRYTKALTQKKKKKKSYPGKQSYICQKSFFLLKPHLTLLVLRSIWSIRTVIFFYSIFLPWTHHKTQSYTDTKFLMKEGIADYFFCSTAEKKQENGGFKLNELNFSQSEAHCKK